MKPYFSGSLQVQTALSEELIKRLAEIYVPCFNAAPWNEQWSCESASSELQQALECGQLITVTREEQLAGFGIGQPLAEYPGFERLVELGVAADAYYVRELATDLGHRRKGVCSMIVNAFQALAAPFHPQLALRTRSDNKALFGLVGDAGLGRICEYEATTGGRESKRIVFACNLHPQH